MNQILGNHIGLVVNNQDPEGRNRLQVFIPHLSNTIYKGWNELLTDVKFKTFDESLFTGELKETILSTLPWAEAAVPIWGGGTGAPVYDSGEIAPIPTDQYVEDADEALPPVEPPLPDFNEGGESGSGDGSGNLPPDQMPMWIENADNREVEVNAGINNAEGRFDGEDVSLGQPSSGSGNSSLADVRSKYAGELNDPNLRRRMYGLIKSEVGNLNADGKTAFVETLFNRSYYRNQNLNTTASSQAYFGVYGVRPGESSSRYDQALRTLTISEQQEYDQLINRALGGSNVSNGAIHAGIPGDPGINEAYGPTKVVIGGEIFYTKNFERNSGKLGVLADAQGENGTYSEQPAQQVMRTTAMGVNAVGSVNGSRAGGPMGVFSTPHVGAKVWVFFLGGNIQKPVYFANVYEPSNVAALN